jgi:hypothetical protein
MVQTEDGRKTFNDISETGRITIFKSLLEDGRIKDIEFIEKTKKRSQRNHPSE